MAQVAYDQALLNTPETKITTLANGFRVVTEQTPHQTATVAVHVDAGSRFENAQNNGTAHFLEHMAFKGTNNRAQAAIEKEVETKGMRLDAYTSREATVYTARCFSADAGNAVSLLGDILTNSKFDAAAVEVERGVILREMQEVNSIPEEVVMDYLHSTAFQGSPLGHTILGPEENIKSITRDDLVKYIDTFYTAPRMVLVGTGGVDHDALVKAAEAAFGGLSSENRAPAVPAYEFHGSEIKYRDDSKPNATFAIAVEGCSWASPDYYPLMVASSIIGSWDRTFGGGQNLSSNLARACAQDKLAHSFMSFNTAYTDTGLWGAYAVTPYDKVEDFCYDLTQEWMRLSHDASAAEVERAKTLLKAGLMFSVDSLQALNDEIGRQILTLGRRMPAVELDARISAVDSAAVVDVMSRYVYDRCPAVSAVGPIEQFPDYNRLRGTMFWLRS
jgi:processing peptidase subunit beta